MFKYFEDLCRMLATKRKPPLSGPDRVPAESGQEAVRWDFPIRNEFFFFLDPSHSTRKIRRQAHRRYFPLAVDHAIMHGSATGSHD